MRHLPILAALAAVALLITGCEERTNMRELPDRGGHAYRTGGAERPLPAGAAVPVEGETFHVVVQGDNLKKLAQKYGVTEGWLIRRNRLSTNVLTVGDNVIVPKAPAK